MENATRALVMAGGILIAVLILGALLLAFSNLSYYQEQNDSNEKSSQIAEFNNQFEAFNKKNLTLMELKSVWNKINSNNTKYPEYKIEENIEDVYANIDKNFKNETYFPEENKQNKKFECINIEYKNSEGRISKMEFKEV